MPELKPIHVVLILAIVAIVALYALGVGLGATDKSSRRERPADRAQALRERFMKPRPVTAEELVTDCSLEDGVLSMPRGAVCDVDVKASETRMRSLELAHQPTSMVRVEVTPRGKPSVPAKFNPLKESKTLDITEEGADLKVTCLFPVPPAPACTLGLLPPP